MSRDKGSLKTHLSGRHDIGEGKTHACSACDYTTKNKSHFKTHLWEVHDIGEGETHACSECTYTTKNKGSLKTHLSGRHDIGDFQCDFCWGMKSRVNTYYDEKMREDVEICRPCYHKRTGHGSRPEKLMVEYLRAHPSIGPYIVLADQILRGDACKTRRRPDILVSSGRDLSIIVECDENQHSAQQYSCETGRMDELLDEITDGHVVFIRWNPDGYSGPGSRVVTFEERLDLLGRLIEFVVASTPTETILVYYMFYSADNEVITKRLPKRLVYGNNDF